MAVQTVKMQEKQSITVRCVDIEDLEKQAEAIRVEQIKLYESYADGVLRRDVYIEKKKTLSEKLAALQDSIRTEKEEQECADELDEEIRNLTKQASQKTYIGGLTKECVDAFVSMVYLYDDQTMKVEFNCEDVIRRALEKYGAYDKDEEGNLVINPEEAQTVKVIYYLYLNGYSLTEIATLLMEYSRKTKLGRVEWNPGTLAGVLANERHCGDVLARKTFTPNFLTHKSKKNNNDRTQYRQKNHHEAIVSREVFNAANHLRASRNYSKKNRPLPVLSVVEDGILRGYVPFDKDWTGFSAEEYREASESVMKEPDVTVTADVKKRLDLTGYEIVRVQYFSTMQNPAMTISNGRLRFNTACLKKFENVEYVELLLNSVERCIAIRPCDKNNPNAIRWGRLKEGRWCASTLGCRGLAKTLFDIMEWDEDLRYRFRGQFLEQGDNKMMLFAFDEPEMIKVEEIVLPPKENTEEDEGETVKKKIYIFPPEWAGTFGQPITSIAQVGILRQEHYAGNWDVFRPATEIEEMNIFTAESLNELLREAEKIMEGWTDYR